MTSRFKKQISPQSYLIMSNRKYELIRSGLFDIQNLLIRVACCTDENDTKFEERHNFESLGATFNQRGSWDTFLEMQGAKMRRTFGRNYAFYREAPVSVKLKVQTAHMAVFFLGMHCAEVHHTSSHDEHQIDGVQAQVLRAILHLPKTTSHAKIRHILGQSSMSTTRL